MSRLLLDTSAYAAFFRDHPGVKEEVREVSDLFLSPIVLGELRSGFLKGARREANEKDLREFLASPRCTVPVIDDETSLRYAAIHDYRSTGFPERPLDRRDGGPARPDGRHPQRQLRRDPARPRPEVRASNRFVAEVIPACRPSVAPKPFVG